jgi:hypothetical protein
MSNVEGLRISRMPGIPVCRNRDSGAGDNEADSKLPSMRRLSGLWKKSSAGRKIGSLDDNVGSDEEADVVNVEEE